MSRRDRDEVPQDWGRATWEGATRASMRRWAELPLERIIAAQEEMAELAAALGHEPVGGAPHPRD